ncbi:MAG TPA: DUF6272 family protein [Flavobacteriales bacterium]
MNRKAASANGPNVLFEQACEGVVTSGNVTSILDFIQNEIAGRTANDNTTKATRLAIECLQNMVRHAHEGATHVVIYQDEHSIKMRCRNLVKREDKEALEKLFGEIADLPRSEYQRLYREKLLRAHINKRGGAGIGLYDMAYRMGKPPVYEITPANDGLYYYTITIELAGL